MPHRCRARVLPRVPLLASPFLVLALAAAGVDAQQPRPEVLRGRVVADSGSIPLAGADVVVTVPPDRAERVTTTDSAGRFELRFPQGTGDYLVHVGLLGWQPWRRRVRFGAADTVDLEARLAAQAVGLAPIAVQAARAQPQVRVPDLNPGTGAHEQTVDGVNAAVPVSEQGDLAALAATTPGVNAVQGGVSVLGLPPSQNNATLNGMAFGGAGVPREARSWTRVTTSTFDPARGGFSGAQVNVDLVPGGIFGSRHGFLTLDAPPLQYDDPVAARLGQRFTSFQAGLGADGELVRDRYTYNVAAQASRRSEDATSLAGAGADVLQPAGVSPDSAARFLQLLAAAGIPATAGAAATSRRTTAGSFIARLDHTPDAARSWALTAFGSYTRADAALSPLATAAHGGRNSSARAMLQAEHQAELADGHLNLARAAFSYGADRAAPALELPDASVLVGSSFADGSAGLASLAFGGNAALDADLRRWTAEATDELRLYGRDSRHRVKLFGDLRLDGFSRTGTADRLGSYRYSSLADLAANRPASYTRTLAAPQALGGEWTGVLAASDTWRTGRLSLLFGARAEANRYTAAPAANPAVQAAFGARTDVAPDRLHISPRLGFSYSLHGPQREMLGIIRNPVGTRILGSRGVLRGGIGEFRSLLPATLLADAMTSTGLADASRRLACVGPAVPIPDWTALQAGAAPPAACADGSGGFVDAAPAVRLLDPGYDAARSWRANLGWSGVVLGMGATLDGIFSLNLAQPGVRDLNFGGTPRFTLADENRPVYVDPSAIVASTGALSPLQARRDAGFARVLSQGSDLRGYGRQLTLTLAPGQGGMGPGYFARLAYTLADARGQARGFDGAAFGDPTLRETAPTDYDIRHQFQLQAGYATPWLDISLFGVLRSGLPFTPLVAGDVNGDGVAGDRAFVYDPARTSDAALAAGMRTLLAAAPGGVRHCLERQLGRPAARNSCRGPWTADLRAQLALGNRFPGAGGRVHATLDLSNVPGGLDQLLHGAGGLHGWGTAAYPDPVLYQARGFDPANQRFLYDVNPRFGDTRPSATTLRAPFRVTLDVRVDLGKPIGQQQLERSLAPGHRLPEAALRQLYARNVIDVYDRILEQSDSLLLSDAQARALQAAHARYRARLDSLWTDLAAYVAGLPERYDGAAALKRQESTVDEGWDITWKEGPVIRSILSPLQMRMLPQLVGMILNARERPRIRIVTNRR